MKFLADIPFGHLTLEHLCATGHDVVAAAQLLSPTASDTEIVQLAAAQGRVLLCFDLDLAAIVALSKKSLPSVITFRTTARRAEAVNARLDQALPLTKRIWSVEPW